MSVRTKVHFDGHDLTALYVVGNLQRPLLPRRAEWVSVPGADGAIFAGVVEDTRKLSMTMTVRDQSPTARAQAARELAAWLDVDGPRPLYISEDSGLYYMALPSSDADGRRYVGAESFDVEFTCEPFLYGEARAVTLDIASNTGSQHVVVGGTKPTPVRLDLALTGSGEWRFAVDGDDAYTATLTGSAAMTFDAEKRVATRGGDVYALPPEDEWIWLEPGPHLLRSFGARAQGTLTFIERWV